MKKVILILILLLSITLATAIPVEDVALNNYVNDYTSTLTAEQSQSLTVMLQSLDQEGIEYAIVIIDTTQGVPIEEYALEIANEKIGGEEDKGMVTLIALDDRKYYTAIGYGLEGDLNDAKIGRLQRNYLVPLFKEGAYGEGLINLAGAIHQELLPNKEIPGNIIITEPPERNFSNYSIFTFIVILFIIRVLANLAMRKKRSERDTNDAFAAALLASMFMRGRGGGGFGGGGFGGFSGGGFGGGGAGGGW